MPSIDINGGQAAFETWGPVTGDPSVPLPLLRAERDLGASFFPDHQEPFKTTNPGSEVVSVEGATHMIHELATEWFCGRLDAFLSETGST